jgi:hypothetical protein
VSLTPGWLRSEATLDAYGQPDAWRYLVGVQDVGKPADTTG